MTAVEPLLNDWLLHPMTGTLLPSDDLLSCLCTNVSVFGNDTDNEASELAEIRTAYLPEVVLAYNSVLHFAGHAISREMLLQCMQLAAVVAAQDSDVAACFNSAGRMSELVDAFAITSKSILKANEQGSKTSKGRKKSQHGETLELWTIKGS